MLNDEITLGDVINIDNPANYKLHLACANEHGIRPLDEYVADRSIWHGWNEWRRNRNDWTRQFIFSFIEFYPISNAYLFGGVFEVKERHSERYVVEEIETYRKWEGRLICQFYRYQGLRGRAFLLENHIDSFKVHSVLSEKYDGEQFCGYESVNHLFSNLHPILLREKQDWKAALIAIKGVYLIIDCSNGKSYVGSAYGDSGIWSRLSCYLITGHGWNDQLVKTIKEKGIEYARANFKFSILEVFTFNTPDSIIQNREAHWKNVLLSRPFGYNSN